MLPLFVSRLHCDRGVVTAGLKPEHSSSPVEGYPKRITAPTRQIYRRTNLHLLRKRAIHLEQHCATIPSRKVRQIHLR